MGLQEILADCTRENKPKILKMINGILGSEPTSVDSLPGKRKNEFAEPKAQKNLKAAKCPEELENENTGEAPEPDAAAAAYADTKPLVPEVPDLAQSDNIKPPDADDVDTIRKQLEEQRLLRAMNKEKSAQKPGPKKASKKSKAAKKDREVDDENNGDEAEDEMQTALDEQDKVMKTERETEDNEKQPRRGRGRGKGRGRGRGKNTQKRKEPEHEQDNGNDAENQPEEKNKRLIRGKLLKIRDQTPQMRTA